MCANQVIITLVRVHRVAFVQMDTIFVTANHGNVLHKSE